MRLQSLLDRTWSWQLSCYCGRGPSNDGGGRRRGGQWFRWFASCRSGQLRLNCSNGLTRTDLGSQTRWNGHSHVSAGNACVFLAKHRRRRRDLLKDKEKRWEECWNETERCHHYISIFIFPYFLYYIILHIFFRLHSIFSHLCVILSSSLNPKSFLWLIFSTCGD